MNRNVFAKFFLLALIGIACSSPGFAANRVALVIGNGDYGTSPLRNPVNDAKDIGGLLKKLDFQVATKLNADRRTMEEAIDRFYRQLQRADVGFFYYAGHGMQIDGQNFLIPVGARVTSPSDVKYRSLDARIVLGKMQDAGNKVNIVVLDACRDNPFRSYFRSQTKGLASMTVPAGTILAYATAANSVAADGEGRNGLYTEQLLRNLEAPENDVIQVFNRTALDVRKRTGEEQQPFIYFNGLEPVYLAGGSMVVEDDGGGRKSEESSGKLKVRSTPSAAKLYVDGAYRGTTPLELGGLEKGKKELELRHKGYESERKKVAIRPGVTSSVSFVLSRLSRTGWLTVSPDPDDARVRILNIGPKYQDGMELEEGRYEVEVSAEGYEEKIRWVKLSAGEYLDIDIALERAVAQRSRSLSDPVTGMEFVRVEGGCFQMGDTFGDGDDDEEPVHEVCVDGFYMGKYEVTVGQWRRFVKATDYRTEAERDVRKDGCRGLKNNDWGWQDGFDWEDPGFSQSSSQPVACVSHNDVERFIDWLNRESGRSYRLPTEAEWEYAARGGTSTVRYWGDDVDSSACRYANVADEAHNWSNDFPCDDGYKYSSSVGKYRANDFGLYDMLGNVWEWTGDWYDDDYYKNSPRRNPTGPGSGVFRVVRGGGWNGRPAYVRAAVRSGGRPWERNVSVGFRLVAPFPGQ